MDNDLLNFLCTHAQPSELNRINQKLPFRTKFLQLVLEDIYQPHEGSSIIRTADNFGVQDVHIIENKHQLTINAHVVAGANRWVDLHYYNETKNNTVGCLKALRKDGFRIVAVSNTEGIPMEEFDVSKKMALVFGNEILGFSTEAKSQIDESLRIPVGGFADSLTTSTNAGIVVNRVMHKIKNSNIFWQLSESQQYQVKLAWVKKIVRRSDVLEKEFETTRR